MPSVALEQDDELLRGIALWRALAHVDELARKEDYDTLMADPQLFHLMQVLDLGLEEAEAMAARYSPTKDDE